MTTELAPIEGAQFATCPDCDATLLVNPHEPWANRQLVHEGDGLHGFAGLTRPLSELDEATTTDEQDEDLDLEDDPDPIPSPKNDPVPEDEA